MKKKISIKSYASTQSIESSICRELWYWQWTELMYSTLMDFCEAYSKYKSILVMYMSQSKYISFHVYLDWS